MKRFLIVCVIMIGLAGCGRREQSMPAKPGPSTALSTEQAENDEKLERVLPADGAGHGSALSDGASERLRAEEETSSETGEKMNAAVLDDGSEFTVEEMQAKFRETHYSGLSEQQIENRLVEGAESYAASGYYDEVTRYWEDDREVRDIDSRIQPLFYTDMKYYNEEDFYGLSSGIIRLAINEIYAKHGYIFKDTDLQQYFMGCAWYRPTVDGSEFDESVLNDYEKKNIEVLNTVKLWNQPPEELPLEFTFSSGAGAWGTWLTLNPDGSFEGAYSDSDMGSSGEGYPGGTVYICEFSGRFDGFKRINEYTYSMTLSELTAKTKNKEEWIEDDIRFIPSDPYGLESGKEFFLYTPQAPTGELPEGFLSWRPWLHRQKEEGSGALSCFGLYNKEPEYGFFTYE